MIGIARPIPDRFNQGLSNSHPHKRHAAARTAQDAAGTSPATAPDQAGEEELEISASLPRRSLSTEEEKLLAALLAAWANVLELQGLLAAASAIVRARFIAAILRAVTDEHDSFVGTKP
jgi:hypothetical protein